MRQLLEGIKIARPGFWPTQLWFFLLPFAQRSMFDQWTFWVGCVYVCFPLGYVLYGWNDISDHASDALNERKDSFLFGARPDAETRRKLPLRMALSQLPFVVLFSIAIGWRALAWFAALVFVNALYNGRRWGWKNWPGFDLLNQAGYLLVFVLASWLCAVPQLSWPVMLFCALFAMQSHLFGQLMDVDEDRAAGRRTTACVLGRLGAKLLLAAIMVVEAGLAWRFFSAWYLPLFMLAGALFFFLDALALFRARAYPQWFVVTFFLGWNAVALASMFFVWRDNLFLLRP